MSEERRQPYPVAEIPDRLTGNDIQAASADPGHIGAGINNGRK
ncbi:MAG: hypothetical protein QXS54_02510 [Candidatus Methanomethylicaceae archaeon]